MTVMWFVVLVIGLLVGILGFANITLQLFYTFHKAIRMVKSDIGMVSIPIPVRSSARCVLFSASTVRMNAKAVLILL